MHADRLTALVATIALVSATPLPQAPTGTKPDPFTSGTSTDPFAPNGILGGLLLSFGNVTNGPAPKGCSKYELIVARGTGEPGPFGTIVGDPLVASVTKTLPGSRGYAVQYPANFNLQYSPQQGMDDVINRLNNQNKECPDQTFVAVGYSQGAGVWHNALGPSPGAPLPLLPSPRPKLDASVIPKIKAFVMFGDPGFKGTEGPMNTYSPPFPSAINAVLRENCAPGDPVCDPAGSGFQNHLTYVEGAYQRDSVAFILAGFSGQPLPKSYKNSNDTAWIAMTTAAKTQSKPWGTIVYNIVTNFLKGLL
ncbi:alpha/beta-hydrolase [Microthyrium microscopicum]|uniref:Alpha/beta-hydrolase n=1 Tax=Microthyrium microscopicum TaxID=703497 RepID=A0A6A6U4A5_9PEZI|nr:alpha/beta-hydrolase [Microthyrium microscopicum]